MTYNFYQLLNLFEVKIPLIQRDYAQGRDSVGDLRNSFVSKLERTIRNLNPLHLDFIYGYETNSNSQETIFVPLDGQQRLTTLWLIHYYFASREKHIIDDGTNLESNRVKKVLHKFSYETRSSSTRFCKALIENPLNEYNLKDSISFRIVDQPWFMTSWIKDPTVRSMLVMLDAIENKFEKCPDSFVLLKTKPPITFEYIDIKAEKFKLTDELYIKMNSRGKPLTTFENFKAQFSDLISSKETDYKDSKILFDNVEVTYSQYFAFKIDGKWMDLFWSYRDKIDLEIDEYILNFFNEITELLFYKSQLIDTPTKANRNIRKIDDIETLKKVYSSKSNLDFLFTSLDLLEEKNIIALFKEIFSFGLQDENKIELFDNESKDILQRVLSNKGFDIRLRLLFYTMLKYGIEIGFDNSKDKLKDLLRIIRNIVFNTRQTNQKKRIEFSADLRITDFREFSSFIDHFVNLIRENPTASVHEILVKNNFIGFRAILVKSEQRKASILINNPDLKPHFYLLENQIHIKGNIDNFNLESKDISYKIKAFLSLWVNIEKNSSLSRALLVFGDYSVQTHYYSMLGKIRFFGSINYWNSILTTLGDNQITIRSALDKFLSAFIAVKGDSNEEKLQILINTVDSNFEDWRYYFIKYPYFLSTIPNTLNLFTWSDNFTLDMQKLGNSGKQPLASYHMNPFLYNISELVQNNKVDVYYGRYGELSYINVQDEIYIYGESKYFYIQLEEKIILDKSLINLFNLRAEKNDFILEDFQESDRIIRCVNFINTYLEK